MSKVRLDLLLMERNLADNQEQAKRLVMAGLVFSNQLRLDKPGMQVNKTMPLMVKQKSIPYVGRGGLKLEKALRHFEVDIKGKIMVDVGSSTGGFTDCALKNGAKLSYAIDVGHNQLDWRLRKDPRVIVMEKTNFRYVTADLFQEQLPNFATVDVSFISLKNIFPVLRTVLHIGSDVIALIKPQFEAKREDVGEKGIVRDRNTHIEVLKTITKIAEENGFKINDVTYSPITGGDGNIEFLAHFTYVKLPFSSIISNDALENSVFQAHKELMQSKES